MNNYISNSLSDPSYLFQWTRESWPFPIFPSFFKIPRITWASPFPTSITITICCIVRLPVSLLVWGSEDFPGSVETKSWDLQRTARHEWNLNKNAAAHLGVSGEPLFQVYRKTASCEYTETTSLPEWQLCLIKVIYSFMCILIKSTPICLFRNNGKAVKWCSEWN